MTVTREIPSQDWREFLHVFSERNLGRPVRLETVIRPGEGTPLIAEHCSLLAVDLEAKGSEAPAIMVMLGGSAVESTQLTHVIHGPRHLWAQEDAAGLALALDIDSTDEGKTLIMFEPEAALPSGE